jgi:uncharacterized membrane protein YbhN (UPF0104 family)
MPLLGSAAAVLALYAVQIHAWRVIVSAWDARLPYWTAARIWCLSNLARFLPASPLFTTGTMGVLASRAGVSPVVAAGSALIGTVLNLGTGFVVVVVTGAGLLGALAPRLPPAAGPALAVAGGLALILLPLSIAPLVRVASRLLRRPVELPPLPLRVLAVAVTANVAAWFLYGLALRWLTLAFFPGSGSNLLAYLAVFTAAYLAGFLFVPVPAGIGIREAALMAGLPAARLVTAGEAAVVVVASRLLLTVLEALPGALFLLARQSPARPRSTS